MAKHKGADGEAFERKFVTLLEYLLDQALDSNREYFKLPKDAGWQQVSVQWAGWTRQVFQSDLNLDEEPLEMGPREEEETQAWLLIQDLIDRYELAGDADPDEVRRIHTERTMQRLGLRTDPGWEEILRLDAEATLQDDIRMLRLPEHADREDVELITRLRDWLNAWVVYGQADAKDVHGCLLAWTAASELRQPNNPEWDIVCDWLRKELPRDPMIAKAVVAWTAPPEADRKAAADGEKPPQLAGITPAQPQSPDEIQADRATERAHAAELEPFRQQLQRVLEALLEKGLRHNRERYGLDPHAGWRELEQAAEREQRQKLDALRKLSPEEQAERYLLDWLKGYYHVPEDTPTEELKQRFVQDITRHLNLPPDSTWDDVMRASKGMAQQSDGERLRQKISERGLPENTTRDEIEALEAQEALQRQIFRLGLPETALEDDVEVVMTLQQWLLDWAQGTVLGDYGMERCEQIFWAIQELKDNQAPEWQVVVDWMLDILPLQTELADKVMAYQPSLHEEGPWADVWDTAAASDMPVDGMTPEALEEQRWLAAVDLELREDAEWKEIYRRDEEMHARPHAPEAVDPLREMMSGSRAKSPDGISRKQLRQRRKDAIQELKSAAEELGIACELQDSDAWWKIYKEEERQCQWKAQRGDGGTPVGG